MAPQKPSHVELICRTVINALCIVVIAGAWIVGKVDSTVAIGTLLALSGVDLVGKVSGKIKSASGSSLAMLVMAGSMATADPPPMQALLEVIPNASVATSLSPDTRGLSANPD